MNNTAKIMTFTGNQQAYDNIKKRIWAWIKACGDSDFSANDVDRDLDLVEQEEKAIRFDVLNRLVDVGSIERIGRRANFFRYVNKDLKRVDYRNAVAQPFDIRLPFDLSLFSRVFAKSIILISGDPNTGKTTVGLNIVKMNMNRGREIDYFSSEMDDVEFKYRLMGFDDVPLDGWNFNPYHRAENFEDVINPNHITIIDFFEIHDKFYQISGKLQAVHDKLMAGKGTGIVIIMLQKQEGRDELGGNFAKQKPRLSLTLSKKFDEHGQLDGSIVKVTKLKFPKGEFNLNGMYRDYKIVNGSNIVTTSQWYWKRG